MSSNVLLFNLVYMAGYKNSPTGVLRDNGGDVQVKRHWHDPSHDRITSVPFFKVIPIYNRIIQGNTKVKMNNRYALQTNPTNSPVFSKVDLTATVVYCPIRFYVYGLYGNNFLELDEVTDLPLPHFDTEVSDSDNFIVGVGSLLSRLRYPQLYVAEGEMYPTISTSKVDGRFFGDSYDSIQDVYGNLNCLSLLAYYDACRYYFADAYDKNLPFEHTVFSVEFNSVPGQQTQSLTREEYIVDYDRLVEQLYGFRFGNASVHYLGFTPDSSFPCQLSGLSIGSQFSPTQFIGNAMQCHDGLFPCTFKPDYYNAWYDSEEVEKLVVSTSGNIQSIRLAQADFNLKSSILVRGKRFTDYNNVLNGGDLSMNDHPIFCGSDRLEIGFQDIVSTATTEDRPLGTPVARGFGKNFDTPQIEFTTHEPGVLLVLVSAIPTVAHNNEVCPDHSYEVFGDIPNRFFDGTGFQELRAGQMNFTAMPELDELAVGSQPFYMEAMVGYDIVDGLLATAGYKSYTMTRTYDLSNMDGFEGDPAAVVDLYYGKYGRTGDFEYIFPSYAPLGIDGLSFAPQLDNIFLYANIDVRLYQPLTNQVITTNSI